MILHKRFSALEEHFLTDKSSWTSKVNLRIPYGVVWLWFSCWTRTRDKRYQLVPVVLSDDGEYMMIWLFINWWCCDDLASLVGCFYLPNAWLKTEKSPKGTVRRRLIEVFQLWDFFYSLGQKYSFQRKLSSIYFLENGQQIPYNRIILTIFD